MPQLVLELVNSERGIERDEHHAAKCRGEQRDHPFRPVRQVYGQSVAGLEAETGQRLSKRDRFTLHLPVGHPARPAYEELPLGVLSRGSRKERRQMTRLHVRHVPHNVGNL